MPTRKAHAEWNGPIDSGTGKMAFGSGAFEGRYSFESRMQDGPGTNPEELIGAAHAGCFSMALSGQLANAGLTAQSIDTTATVTFEKLEAGFTVTEVHLKLVAKIPGADQAAFETAANNAKSGCPISRLLNAKITLDAQLVS